MSFKPINDDHAVQSVAFSIIFEKALGQGVIQHVQSQHHRWSPDLPAIQTPPVFGVEFGPSGAVPMSGHAVEFAYLRPNGTPAWQLRFDGTAVTIECTRYTRWERVWGMAQRHLLMFIDVLKDTNPKVDALIAATSLQYLDQFVGKSAGNDFSELFADSVLVPRSSFHFGDIWHAHSGWFDKSSDLGPILNNLNIDTNTDASRDGNPVVAGVLHLQQLRYANRLSVDDFQVQHSLVFDDMMMFLHQQNKALVTTLLASEMATRIGINASNVEKEAKAI